MLAKYAISTLLGIIVVAALVGFAMGSRWQITVNTSVAAPSHEVISHLADFHTWPEWSVWNKQNFPKSDFSYRGTSRSTGAEQVWTMGPKTTVWHLLQLKPNELTYWRQTNDGPMLNGHFQATDAPGGTHLVWTVSGDTGFNPFYRLIAWFYGDRQRSQLLISLQGLQHYFTTVNTTQGSP